MTTASRDSEIPNEDFAVAAGDVAIVVDGAGVPVSGCRHGVPWFSRQLATRTLAALGASDISLADALAAAIQDVADSHKDTCDLSDGMTPCAAVGILRVGADRVDVLTLSDVTISIETGGDVHAVCDLVIEELCGTEPGVLNGLRLGTTAHQDALAALVRCQTDTRNRPGGWWVAAADPEAAHHAVTAAFDRQEVRRMVAMSDGATRPVDQMGIYRWREYLDLLDKLGPVGLIEHVRDIESADPLGERYARTKRHDDASIAVWSPAQSLSDGPAPRSRTD